MGLSCTASDTANQTASFSATCNGMNGGSNAGYMTVPAYSYTITPAGEASGYAANGNLLSYTDSVMGPWSFNYDSLNRLTGGAARQGLIRVADQLELRQLRQPNQREFRGKLQARRCLPAPRHNTTPTIR